MRKEQYWVKKITGLFIIITLLCSGCGKENKTEQEFKNETKKTVEKKESVEKTKKEKNKYFETEYTIEDYCNGVFIVSKSDGLLYGALNAKGEEIIPVKYDEVKFMNEEESTENEELNLFIQTRFEDKWTVMDCKGKKQVESGAELIFSSPLLNNNDNQDIPCYYECGKSSVKLYNELGNIITEIEVEGLVLSAQVTWVTPDYFLLQTVCSTDSSISDVIISLGYYKRDGSLVKQWDGEMKDSEYTEDEYVFWVSDYNEFSKFSIDKKGNVSEHERVSQEEYLEIMNNDIMPNVVDRINGTETYELANDVQLFHSNGTWKLCDSSGNALYDERYFECDFQGDYETFFLQNEDFDVLVIDSAGKKIVDYGIVTYNKESQTYSFMGTELNWNENYFIDKYSICFAMRESNDITKVYCYGKTE